MGLRDSEYALILERMGREPSLTEVGMFAVMWSEHCGYKYSRPVLRYFGEYKKAMDGAGLENAGMVSLGDGLAVAMKIESHNHPSAVEPYQGAATGVGGIIRDIFTMGARPIACLNSLRFGPIREGDGDPAKLRHNRFLVKGVVHGIGGYGNCVGVPTVAGEVSFHPRYNGRPLVNAMCVGLVDESMIASAGAGGVGNPVIYLGSATGKDGIHGATFASEELEDENTAKRPNVQIGDPFAEKLLIEATLEALKTGAIHSIQDMGAAGLTCSTIEMSAKGGVGMEVDLDLVPMREDDMTGYELMLSESQERMLAVAHKGREQEVHDVFRKWGVHAVVIGHVTADGFVRVTRHGEVVAHVRAKDLADGCPTYTTEPQVPAYYTQAQSFDAHSLPEVDLKDAFRRLMASPDLASKEWVFRQYDHEVQTQTALKPGAGDAAVLAPRGTKKGLAVKVDGNGRWVYHDPYVGGLLVVCEAARNVACVGGTPVAVTDGLNYGNPEIPHVYWQFERSVRGLADACDALGTPVISGNVSFYNQGELGEVLPTPMIGMLGILEDADRRVGMGVPEGDWEIGVVGYDLEVNAGQGLGASSFLAEVHGKEDGLPVAPDLAKERALVTWLPQAIHAGTVAAAHDVSEGGLALALAEMLDASNQGGSFTVPDRYLPGARPDAKLFGELPGRILVAIRPGTDLTGSLPLELWYAPLGRLTKEQVIGLEAGEQRLTLDLSEFRGWHTDCLTLCLAGKDPR